MMRLKKLSIVMVLVLVLGLFSGLQASAETVTGDFDFDGDGVRTTADVTLLLRFVDKHTDTGITEAVADVSGDGKVSVYDVVCLMRLLIKDVSLKIATYNIKCAMYGETMNEIAATLKAENADIVGIQEVDCRTIRSGITINQMQKLAELAGYDYYFFAPVVYKPGDDHTKASASASVGVYGHGILSKYPITKSEIIWPEAQTTVADDEVRNVERHEINVDGKTLVFYNSHMDFSQGRYQYKEIQDSYMINDQYAVFVGDMNEKISELEESGCIDYENFTILTKSSRIDHIIVSHDTIGWYKAPDGATGFMTKSTLLDTPVTVGDNTYNYASDHDYWYSHIVLK